MCVFLSLWVFARGRFVSLIRWRTRDIVSARKLREHRRDDGVMCVDVREWAILVHRPCFDGLAEEASERRRRRRRRARWRGRATSSISLTMAVNPRDMDGFMPLLSTTDIKKKLNVGSALLNYLGDSTNSIECQDIGMFIDNVIPWLGNGNSKVSVSRRSSRDRIVVST